MQMAKTRKSPATDLIKQFVESGLEGCEVFDFTALGLRKALDRLFPQLEGKPYVPPKIHVVVRGTRVYLINSEVLEENRIKKLAART